MSLLKEIGRNFTDGVSNPKKLLALLSVSQKGGEL